MRKRYWLIIVTLVFSFALLGGCTGIPEEAKQIPSLHNGEASKENVDQLEQKVTDALLGGSTIGTPTEPKLMEDLLNSDALKEYAERLELEITDFEIVKRQTTPEDKTDTVWTQAALQDTEGTVQISGEYVMTYELYNDGWLLEHVDVTAQKVVPLSAPNPPAAQLENDVVQWGYSGLTDVSIYDQTLDLENGKVSYSLTATDVHTYLTEYLDITLVYAFDTDTCEWPQFCSNLIVNSSQENWDIAGSYGEWIIHSFDGTTIHMTQTNPFYFTPWEVITKVIPLHGTLPENLVVENVLYSTSLDKYQQEGYGIQYIDSKSDKNSDFEPVVFKDVRYFADCLVICPDHLYFLSDTYSRDMRDQNILVESEEF